MLPSLIWYSASAIAAAFRSSQAALVSAVEASLIVRSSTTSGSPTMDFVRVGVIDIARLLSCLRAYGRAGCEAWRITQESSVDAAWPHGSTRLTASGRRK